MVPSRRWAGPLVAALSLTLLAPWAAARAARPRPRPVAKPRTPTLQRALALFARQSYWGASVALHGIATDLRAPARDREEAELYFARALMGLKLYAPALESLDAIARKGARHSQHVAALPWLLELHRRLPWHTPLLETIGRYPLDVLDHATLAPHRDELRFLLARASYYRGDVSDLRRALKLLAGIRKTSPHHLRARFLAAVIHARQARPARAVASFKQVLRAAAAAPNPGPWDRKLAGYARLGLARTFYHAGQIAVGLARAAPPTPFLGPAPTTPKQPAEKMFDLALKHYAATPTSSPEWPQARFEESWTHFMRLSMLPPRQRSTLRRTATRRMLERAELLSAPLLEQSRTVEALLLRAYAEFLGCRLHDAARTVLGLRRRYVPVLREVRRMVELHRDDDIEFAAIARKLRSGTSGWVGAPARLAAGALAGVDVARHFAWEDELARELAAVGRADRRWKATAAAASVLQHLQLIQSLSRSASGQVSRRRLERLARALRSWHVKSLGLEFEILSVQRAGDPPGAKRKRMTPSAPTLYDGAHLWSGGSDYWTQEKGYYRYRARSLCKPLRAERR